MKYSTRFLLLMGLSLSGQTQIPGLTYLHGPAIGIQASILTAHSPGREVGTIEGSMSGYIVQRWEPLYPRIGEMVAGLDSVNDPEMPGRDHFLLLSMLQGEAI